MNELVRQLDEWLQRNRPDYYERLLHGLSDQELHDVAQRLDVTLPDDLQTLYRWKNGQSSDCYESLFFNFMFMNSDAVLEAHEEVRELLDGGDFDKAGWWSNGWIPFLDNGGGDHYCVDVEGSFGGKQEQVIWFLHDDSTRSIMHESVQAWLATVVAALNVALLTHEYSFGLTDEQNEAYDRVYEAANRGYPVKVQL